MARTTNRLAALGVASLMLLVPTGCQKFKNCTELNRSYPHGVGRPGAVDSTKSRKVTNFHVDQTLYDFNASHDRDKDGIACEKA